MGRRVGERRHTPVGRTTPACSLFAFKRFRCLCCAIASVSTVAFMVHRCLSGACRSYSQQALSVPSFLGTVHVCAVFVWSVGALMVLVLCLLSSPCGAFVPLRRFPPSLLWCIGALVVLVIRIHNKPLRCLHCAQFSDSVLAKILKLVIFAIKKGATMREIEIKFLPKF